MQEYIRHAAGSYEACGTLSSRTYEFPLVDVIHPDLRHHPLFAFATVVSVDVPEGAALVLPAYWYHQVESDAQSGSLNVAINYWFSSGSLPELEDLVERARPKHEAVAAVLLGNLTKR